jgi:hypothetical protein
VFFRQGVQSDEASAIHFLQESEQTLLLGASLSVRLGIFSIGASLYYVHENISWLNSRSGTSSTCGATGCDVQQAYNANTQLEGFFGAINPRLGLLLKPTKSFSIGLMASLSSFRMWGAGGFKTGTYGASTGGISGQLFYATDNLFIDRPLPWEIRLGVGLSLQERFHFAADITFYMPQKFTMFAGVPQASLIFPAQVTRNFIVNGNVGFEYAVTPTIPIRFGLFTNLTSAPEVDRVRCADAPCLPWQHSAGATASVGAQLWRVKLDFGAIASYGQGYIQQLDPQGPSRFRWSQADQLQVQLFIGGNLGKVLNETAMEIKDRIEKRALEIEQSKQQQMEEATTQPK